MSFFHQNIPSKNQQITLPTLQKKEVELWIKREDKIHPEVSGNKFRKLTYNIKEAKKQGKKQLLTFGGAFSNHILATAVAANLEGLESIGIIRGEELGNNLEAILKGNPTLLKASKNGMKLYFVSRKQYRDKMSAIFLEKLTRLFGNFYLIPEGGTNALAIKGCQEIITDKDFEFKYICSCVGTGGTLAGLINASKPHQTVLGFPALKGDFLHKEISKWVLKKENWNLVKDYHFGGYAKYSSEFIRFINTFTQQTSIPLDPIYTGKMMFGMLDMIQKDYFKRGSKILLIHTGGLQGIQGFNALLKKKKTNLQIAQI